MTTINTASSTTITASTVYVSVDELLKRITGLGTDKGSIVATDDAMRPENSPASIIKADCTGSKTTIKQVDTNTSPL
jgi:hypothetical protein